MLRQMQDAKWYFIKGNRKTGPRTLKIGELDPFSKQKIEVKLEVNNKISNKRKIENIITKQKSSK